MQTIAQGIEKVVSAALADIVDQPDSTGFAEGFGSYVSTLQPFLSRYRHHLDPFGTVDQRHLKARYQAEIAILAVLTELLSQQARGGANRQALPWPINDADSIFGWYRLPERLVAMVEGLPTEEIAADQAAALLSQVGGHLLGKLSMQHSGEHYTPLSLSDHLIELSGLQPSQVLDGQGVVDPACGGGIILATIAQQVVAHAIRRQVPPQQVIDSLSRNVHGFDVQPFAVTLTRTLLLHSCVPLLGRSDVRLSPPFPNVRLLDPLVVPNTYWSQDLGFHFIIGNPPFMSVKKTSLDRIESYNEVLDGHPNLYQLFLWWAMKAAAPEGIISFLLPQSLLCGSYFRKLRNAMEQRARLLSITRMIDRKGVVGEVDHQMMAVCLRVSKTADSKPDITARVTHNGEDIQQVTPLSLAHSQVAQTVGNATIWVVSDSALDYEVVDRLSAKCIVLDSLRGKLQWGNGGYVWNQHKDLLLEKENPDSIPLISAAAIEPFTVTIPYNGTHACRTRPFSLVAEALVPFIHIGPAILIHRTTPRKVGRRLVAGMPSLDFHARYPRYFLENHVNYVRAVPGTDLKLLYGLLGWLNSDVVNFLFQLRNGTSHVSLFELALLPVSVDIMARISCEAEPLIECTAGDRLKYAAAINEMVYDSLDLNSSHRDRIEVVLSRKDVT